ncbi:MAG: CoA pyrophosphatase [Gemmatimonadota bacterium]|nr:CoA pyrophosphatase [Gemmatimonadota bacterium]
MRAIETLARLESALTTVAGAVDAPGAGPTAVRDASVAVIFRVTDGDSLELLMIQRASYEGDPWSGHVAFPGGRRELEDATLLDTAVREMREELGVDLRATGRVLGGLERVCPLSPVLPAISIAPIVFHMTRLVPLRLSDEVAQAFWVPLATLQRADASCDVDVTLSTGARCTVRAFVHGEYTIWGLTERIIRDLLSRLA